MASIMIVDADRLHETPVAFQQYVETYFYQSNVLGKRVFIAARFLQLTISQRFRRGFAPSHMIELMQFTEGLAKGQDLGAWIRSVVGILVWEFESGYDSDNVVNMD